MQTDMHFYAIYVLCRITKYNQNEAKTIARCSQFTDDSINDNKITLEDGTFYTPSLTSYHALSLKNLSIKIQQNVYMAFHFLPSFDIFTPNNEIKKMKRKAYITKPHNTIATKILQDAITSNNLARIGIALHSFADTWSHQNFSGLLGRENDIENLEIYEIKRTKFSKILRNIWGNIMDYIVPAIGHAEVFNNPDEPYQQWEYYSFFTKQVCKNIDNKKIYLEACLSIYQILGGTIWEKYEQKFKYLISLDLPLDKRCQIWEHYINNGYFDLFEQVSYNINDLFNEAFIKIKNNLYKPKENFLLTDYVLFNNAAKEQQQLFNSILEKKGIKIKNNIWKETSYKFFRILDSIFKLDSRKSFSLKSIKRTFYRFCIYGTIFMTLEISFYTIIKVSSQLPIIKNLFMFDWKVDPKLNLDLIWETPINTLYGQASLWMFFVYAFAGILFIEPIYKKLYNKSWFLRGFLYMIAILFWECLTGKILNLITSYDIWYYADPYNIFKYTSLAIAPMWFFTGLIAENITKFILKYTEHKKIIRKLEHDYKIHVI